MPISHLRHYTLIPPRVPAPDFYAGITGLSAALDRYLDYVASYGYDRYSAGQFFVHYRPPKGADATTWNDCIKAYLRRYPITQALSGSAMNNNEMNSSSSRPGVRRQDPNRGSGDLLFGAGAADHARARAPHQTMASAMGGGPGMAQSGIVDPEGDAEMLGSMGSGFGGVTEGGGNRVGGFFLHVSLNNRVWSFLCIFWELELCLYGDIHSTL